MSKIFKKSKKLFDTRYILFVVFIFYLDINAQQWVNINPFNTTLINNLLDISFSDKQNGIIVGKWGIILKTTDSGASWIVLKNHQFDYDLRSVDFVNKDIAYAVGDYGTILKTTNSGNDWLDISISQLFPFNDIYFIDDTTGWCVGYRDVLFTNDGGISWERQYSHNYENLNAVYFVNNNTGWVVGNNTIIKTTDRGKHWMEQNSNTSWILNDVVFKDTSNGYITGVNSMYDYGILITSDGGNSWEKVENIGIATSLSVINNYIWAAGLGGIIKFSSDNGLTWSTQKSNTSSSLNHILFIDSLKGYAVGDYGTIINTNDEGRNWVIKQTYIPDDKITNGTFIDKDNGWGFIPYSDNFWFTSNGGNNWNKINKAPPIVDLKFFNKSKGIAFDNKYIHKTTDGGRNWISNEIPDLNCIFFINDSLFIGGGDNCILKSYDEGKTWEETNILNTVRFNIRNIFFLNEKLGWAVGESMECIDAGILLKTSDGGNNWEILRHPSENGVGIYFLDSLKGNLIAIAIDHGLVMTTEDGGITWESNFSMGDIPNKITYSNSTEGWVIGYNGLLLKTLDEGKTWEKVKVETHENLNNIVFTDNGRVGYIFGEKNVLLKYEDISNDIKERILTSSKELFSVYPNPFNNQTNIYFTLEENEWVNVSIVDILGKNVVTILNDELLSGIHHIQWSGLDRFNSRVASGIYFCIINISNKKIQIKKLVLLQ